MIRITALVIGVALTLASFEADARCVRGAAGCGVGYHGAGVGARGVGVTHHHGVGVGARGVGVAPGHHHVGNRNGGMNRVGPRR
jgi:hypothetical protein